MASGRCSQWLFLAGILPVWHQSKSNPPAPCPYPHPQGVKSEDKELNCGWGFGRKVKAGEVTATTSRQRSNAIPQALREEWCSVCNPQGQERGLSVDQREEDQRVLSADCMPGTLHTFSTLISHDKFAARPSYLVLTDVTS